MLPLSVITITVIELINLLEISFEQTKPTCHLLTGDIQKRQKRQGF